MPTAKFTPGWRQLQAPGLKFRSSVAIAQQERPGSPPLALIQQRCPLLRLSDRSGSEGRPQSASPRKGQDELADAAKLERLGRLVCGPLWQSELVRTMGVSRQTVLRWVWGEPEPSVEHTAKAKELVRARIGELKRLLKESEAVASVEIALAHDRSPMGASHSQARPRVDVSPERSGRRDCACWAYNGRCRERPAWCAALGLVWGPTARCPDIERSTSAGMSRWTLERPRLRRRF